MQIQTSYFGELDVAEEKIITFENGLPGFSDEKKFVWIDIEGNPAFQVLQSIETEALAFFMTDPFLFEQKYAFKLSDSVVEQLEIEQESDVVIRTFVSVAEPFDASTINLKAPIVINQVKKTAKQIVLNEEDYSTKHPIKSANEGGA